MKKTTFLRQLFVAGFLFLFTTFVQAGNLPKFSVLPLVKAPNTLTFNETGSAQYLVINNTLITRTLTIVPIAGVYQTVAGLGSCPMPFTLAPGYSCVLNLQIVASQIAGRHLSSGPAVCKTISSGNNAPDPFLCSQAAPDDSFKVIVVP